MPRTVPLSGHGPPLATPAPALIGDMPPPSAALTVHKIRLAGRRPELLTSAQISCSSTVVPDAVVPPPRVKNVALPLAPAAATSAKACATLFAPFAATPAGSPVGPASTKSLVKIAFPYWLLYENPPATNWFSSEAACTISALGPPVPFSAFWIAVPVAEPTYLNVNCGYALLNIGWIRFGTRPESLTSLVPRTVSVDDVSALASAGAIKQGGGGQKTDQGDGKQPASGAGVAIERTRPREMTKGNGGFVHGVSI